MHKNIFAILPADEAVAFGVVKPLYRSLFHILGLFLLKSFTWKESEVLRAGASWLAKKLLNNRFESYAPIPYHINTGTARRRFSPYVSYP
jgi:hypothetical protein